jgi:hypothetical protein
VAVDDRTVSSLLIVHTVLRVSARQLGAGTSIDLVSHARNVRAASNTFSTTRQLTAAHLGRPPPLLGCGRRRDSVLFGGASWSVRPVHPTFPVRQPGLLP